MPLSGDWHLICVWTDTNRLLCSQTTEVAQPCLDATTTTAPTNVESRKGFNSSSTSKHTAIAPAVSAPELSDASHSDAQLADGPETDGLLQPSYDAEEARDRRTILDFLREIIDLVVERPPCILTSMAKAGDTQLEVNHVAKLAEQEEVLVINEGEDNEEKVLVRVRGVRQLMLKQPLLQHHSRGEELKLTEEVDDSATDENEEGLVETKIQVENRDVHLKSAFRSVHAQQRSQTTDAHGPRSDVETRTRSLVCMHSHA
jgi:hypothetical protein